jgi:hypothetical protein
VKLELLGEQARGAFDLCQAVLELTIYILVEAFQKSSHASLCVPSHELAEEGEYLRIQPHGELLEDRRLVDLIFLGDIHSIIYVDDTFKEGLCDPGVVRRSLSKLEIYDSFGLLSSDLNNHRYRPSN